MRHYQGYQGYHRNEYKHRVIRAIRVIRVIRVISPPKAIEDGSSFSHNTPNNNPYTVSLVVNT